MRSMMHRRVLDRGKLCSMFTDEGAEPVLENLNCEATRLAGKRSPVYGTAIFLPFLIGTDRLALPHPGATAGDPAQDNGQDDC